MMLQMKNKEPEKEKNIMGNERAPRRYYADPTADAAIGNIMREERAEKRKQEVELKKALIKDFSSALKEAKKIGCKTVNFNAIPIENLELILSALRSYRL